MPRRRITESPLSSLAVWARRLAFFSLVATLIAIIIVRSGLLEIYPAMVTFGGALAFAVIAILVAFAALVAIWRSGWGGLGHALSALFIAAALLAYPCYLGLKAYRLPPITDITTDPIDPPRFEAVARLRPRGANSVLYPGLYAAEQQQTAYPDVEPLMIAVEPKVAYDAALAIANKRRWRVVDAREPQGNREGRIEAVVRTPIMGFRDDIVIRIRGDEDGSRVDARSASRYGRYDFGTNASRLIALLEDIDAASDAPDKASKPSKPAKPSKQPSRTRATKGQAPLKR